MSRPGSPTYALALALSAALGGLLSPSGCSEFECTEVTERCLICGDRFCDFEYEYCQAVDPADEESFVETSCQAVPEACLEDRSCECLEREQITPDFCDTDRGGLFVVYDNSQ